MEVRNIVISVPLFLSLHMFWGTAHLLFRPTYSMDDDTFGGVGHSLSCRLHNRES